MKPRFSADNFFTLFNLPVAFGLDRAALDSAYRAMQTEVHPDKFVSADAPAQRQAMAQATRVNDAYETLKAPVARGRYLLQQVGIDAFDPANTHLSPDFLMQQIAWRERLEAAHAVVDRAALEVLEDEIAQTAHRREQQLVALFDRQPRTAASLEAATETVRELRFIERLAEEIRATFDALDG